jgi:predicted flavoprotein YhiN
MLRKAAGLPPAAISLLREDDAVLPVDPEALARRIKSARVVLTGMKPIDRAISTAGGITFDEVDDSLMLRRKPGVFAAGEMLDWEAPTGGYLLQACFASGVAAGNGVLAYLNDRAMPH